jgi:hypothetical protein
MRMACDKALSNDTRGCSCPGRQGQRAEQTAIITADVRLAGFRRPPVVLADTVREHVTACSRWNAGRRPGGHACVLAGRHISRRTMQHDEPALLCQVH